MNAGGTQRTRSQRVRGDPDAERLLPEHSPWPWRGLLVGLVGVCIGSFATAYSSLYLNSSQLAEDYLPIGIFSLFLILLGLNAGARAIGIGLSRADLFMAYMTMLVSAAMPVSGFATRLLPILAGQYYYATPENRWSEYFFHHVPTWFGPRDRNVTFIFFEGTEKPWVPWDAWLLPVARWLLPVATVNLMLFSLGILLRRQWIEAERLVFPLAQVPLALTEEEKTPSYRTETWRSRLFWVAVLIPCVINSLNGLHHFYPAVPNIPYLDPNAKPSLGGFLSDPLWKYMYRDFFFEFHFALFGVALMMRKEVSLSLWFFQVLFEVIMFFFLVSGIGPGQYAYTPRETFGYLMLTRWTKFGAALVIAGLIVWSFRGDVARACRAALRPFGRQEAPGDRLVRWGLWMFCLGLAGYLAWAHVIGLAPTTAIGILVISLVGFLVTARIIAEGGLIWASIALDPIITWPRLYGTANLSPQTITALAYTGFIPLAARGNTLPSVMDGLKISHSTGIRPRHALLGMALSLLVAAGVSAGIVLYLTYAQGGNFMSQKQYSYGPRWLFNTATQYFLDQVGPSWEATATIVAGMLLMAILYKLHRRFIWWPFYPLGYVIAETEVMQHQWMSILIGWLVRGIVVRFRGAAGYRAMRPAALGVIVGDLASVFLWFLIFALTGTTGKSLTHDAATW